MWGSADAGADAEAPVCLVGSWWHPGGACGARHRGPLALLTPSPRRLPLAAVVHPHCAPLSSPSRPRRVPVLSGAHLFIDGTHAAPTRYPSRVEKDPALKDLMKDWDFSPGNRFQAEVLHKFSSSVHHTSSSPNGSFLLVVFQRYLFRLTEDSVAMALHCCLGGTPAGFHVTFLKERHFYFSVASKHVGLFVRALRRITTDHF